MRRHAGGGYRPHPACLPRGRRREPRGRASHDRQRPGDRRPPGARREAGAGDATTEAMAAAFAAEVADRLHARLEGHRDDFGVPEALLARTLGDPAVKAAVRAAQHESRLRAIGQEVLRTRGANHGWLEPETAVLARDSARSFARKV